jgi:tellurite resistance-related uncharacterized protein
MEREILGFHQDAELDWVAELSCGHRQHLRHRPPFQDRPWVLEEQWRAQRIGTPLDCPLCDRAELPEHCEYLRTTPEWTEETAPPALLRVHRLARGIWGRITLFEGSMRFVMPTGTPGEVELDAGDVRGVPPEIDHVVVPLGGVRFSIELFRTSAAS